MTIMFYAKRHRHCAKRTCIRCKVVRYAVFCKVNGADPVVVQSGYLFLKDAKAEAARLNVSG